MPAPISTVEAMLLQGSDTIEEISQVCVWPVKSILAKAEQLNLKVDSGGKPVPRPRMTSGAVHPSLAPVPPQPPTPIRQPMQGAAPATEAARCSHAGMISWAKAHPKAAVRAKGEKFETLMADLIHLRRELDVEDRQRAERETARKAALAEVEEAKRRLREAEDRAVAAGAAVPKAKRHVSDAQRAALQISLGKAREAKAAKAASADGPA